MARQKRKIGDVLSIKINDQEYCFGRVLEEPVIAFYDKKCRDIPELKEIISSPVLFKICVMNSAVTKGRWEVIGNRELEDDLKEYPLFFKQDAITKKFSIYDSPNEYDATKEDCLGLERAAVWSANHVEDRLRDFYDGKPNKWVEVLKIKD